MKTDMRQFDIVMSGLKAIEPSEHFDFEFRRRLSEAVAKRYEETVFERLARRALESLESIRYSLIPKVPALARSLAVSVFFIVTSVFVYSIQPSCPGLTGSEGIVMVSDASGNMTAGVGGSHRFKPGDIISTGPGSSLDMGISDKYAIRLKENAKVRIAKLAPRFGKGKVNFELIEGQMLVSVDHGFKGSRFVVDSNAAQMTALGTKFSVDVRKKEKPATDVSVLEGKVEVVGRDRNAVFVGAGQKTEVLSGEAPMTPRRMVEKEWASLDELYQIGKKPQVVLLLKNTPDRVMQLLRPCPIYISDEKPRQIPDLIEKAVLKTKEAIESKDAAKHFESIKMLQRIVDEHPDQRYDAQLLLYIGAYYEYMADHKNAIKAFEQVIVKYPNSTMAGMAQCAVAIIYEEKLNELQKAQRVYRSILEKYPNSLEAIWVEERLGIKK